MKIIVVISVVCRIVPYNEIENIIHFLLEN